jgi:hypothetical protein
MFRRQSLLPLLVLLLATRAPGEFATAEEDITAHVLTIDRPARCLEIDWHNDTRKEVCWTDATRFTVLETEQEATADEIRVGSYLHVRGEERDGVLHAASIEIWESAARPESP